MFKGQNTWNNCITKNKTPTNNHSTTVCTRATLTLTPLTLTLTPDPSPDPDT